MIETLDPRRLADIAAFIGMALLAVPTLSINRRKKRLRRVEDVALADDADPGLRALRERLRADRAREAAGWRRSDEICLYAGYALMLGASALRLAAE